MPATQSSDFVFVPKVWQDHIAAYFVDKLVFGAVAAQDDTLKGSPGETKNFPFFTQIGAVEEPAEDESLTVDKLEDDSFSATIKEVGKAVGIKKKAFRVSAANQGRIIQETTSQMARRFAEKVDDDIITEIQDSNYTTGFTASAAADQSNIINLAKMKHTAFGDRANEAVACFMHSQNMLSLLTDSTAGFLKADALDPFFRTPGFQGRLLGMAIFETDKCPAGGTVDSQTTKYVYMMKANPYGIITAEDYLLEEDRDILARENVYAATMWYAVKAFHAKVSADDKRIARGLFTTVIAA